jgi:GNAT superfamily N-acetyltransferase
LRDNDALALFNYFNEFSAETRRRFGPHPFDWDTTERLCLRPPANEWRFIGEEITGKNIIAYAIIKKGYLLHDTNRLSNYGLSLSDQSDCTFAPSVADAWQGSGAGSRLFEYILPRLMEMKFKRIILWGGVQATNERAVKYYQKLGFKMLGEFDYNGKNYDMALEIR